MSSQEFSVVAAHGPEWLSRVRSLFMEYAESLPVNLCFQGFDQELATLPGDYAPPAGRLLVITSGGELAACGALRMFADGVGELKRMYVRPAFRGRHLGRRLADDLTAAAREIGYRYVRLDTLPDMTAAIALYQSLGFVEIGAYRHNPVEGHKQMELVL